MKRYVRNGFIASLSVYGLLWLLTYQGSVTPVEDEVTVRQVNTAIIKPPVAPPQTMRSNTKQQEVSLSLVESHEQVVIKVSALDITLPEIVLPDFNTRGSESIVSQYQALSNDDIVDDILTFSLDELDQKPRLLTRITARLPRSLKMQGVNQSRIILHVIIHETGRVELVNVEKVDYPSLKKLVPDMIHQARFSSPIRYGKKVKAEFLWPITIKK